MILIRILLNSILSYSNHYLFTNLKVSFYYYNNTLCYKINKSLLIIIKIKSTIPDIVCVVIVKFVFKS